MKKFHFSSAMLAVVMMTACEKPVIDDIENQSSGNSNVMLTFSTYGQQEFTRAAVP